MMLVLPLAILLERRAERVLRRNERRAHPVQLGRGPDARLFRRRGRSLIRRAALLLAQDHLLRSGERRTHRFELGDGEPARRRVRGLGIARRERRLERGDPAVALLGRRLRDRGALHGGGELGLADERLALDVGERGADGLRFGRRLGPQLLRGRGELERALQRRVPVGIAATALLLEETLLLGPASPL